MVEYAFTALITFSLLMFIIDGGRIFMDYVTVSEAARVGARYGITHGSRSAAPISPGNYAALRQEILSRTPLDPADLAVTASWTPGNSPGSKITVQVSYVARPVTNLFWPGATLNLTGVSTMVIQN
jgi:Flp pilus assembly protein TadG